MPILAQKHTKNAIFWPFLAHFCLFFSNFRGHICFQKWPIGHIFWPETPFLYKIFINWPNKSGQWPDFFIQKWPINEKKEERRFYPTPLPSLFFFHVPTSTPYRLNDLEGLSFPRR